MLSRLLILCTSIGAAGGIFLDTPMLLVPETIGLVGFLLVEFRRIARMGQALILLSLALPLYMIATGQLDLALAQTAVNRAAFFTLFLVALAFLQHAAGGSPLMMRSGRILVEQPPGRRYVVLTFGAGTFGALVNLGTVTLLGTMISRSLPAGDTAEARRISAIRLRRMTLALLRGFATLPMWSPITVTMAVITAAIPTLSYFQILLHTAPLTAVFLLIGWGYDRMSNPRPRTAPAMTAPSLFGLAPLLVLVVLLPATAYGASVLMGTTMIQALVLWLPLIAVLWMAIQRRPAPLPEATHSAMAEVRNSILPALPGMRTEFALFNCSAFLGVLLTAMIDTTALGEAVQAAGLSSGAVLAISAWLVVGLSLVGASAIITVTVLAGTLPAMTPMAIDVGMIGVAMVSAWAISAGMTPYSGAVRMTARTVAVDPAVLGLRWNGVFTLTCLLLLTVFLLIAG